MERVGRKRKKRRSRISPKRFEPAVRLSIKSQLFQGHPGILRTAAALGSSVRTVQRRLAREGLTYSDIVDRVRHQEARRLLEVPGIRLADIATDLGFGDPSSFTRAFGRWAGTAPIRYRRSLRERNDRGTGAHRARAGTASRR